MIKGSDSVTIAFPTYNRCGAVTTWSYMPVTTWAAVEPQQMTAYHATYPQYALRQLPSDLLNISSKRQWILEQAVADGHRWLFMLEDDLEGLFLRQGKTAGGHHKLVKTTWNKVLQPMIDCADQLQLAELGLSQQQSNHFYDNDTVAYACKATEFCLLDLHLLQQLGVGYDSTLSHFEDFDLTINILRKGGRTGLYLLAAFGHALMGSNPGGHQSPGSDRSKDTLASIEYLVNKYPGYVSLKQGRVFPEPRVAWTHLRKAMPII